MTCKHCQSSLKHDINFCHHCGTKIPKFKQQLIVACLTLAGVALCLGAVYYLADHIDDSRLTREVVIVEDVSTDLLH